MIIMIILMIQHNEMNHNNDSIDNDNSNSKSGLENSLYDNVCMCVYISIYGGN